jgi:hypothetical protein
MSVSEKRTLFSKENINRDPEDEGNLADNASR